MRYKFIFNVFIISIILALNLGCLTEAADTKPLIFTGDRDYPPIESLRDGELYGYNVDLIKALSKAMGRDIEIQLMDWADAQQMVLDGKADALTLLGYNEKRGLLYDFAEPMLKFEFSFFVKHGDITIHSIKDIKGKTVAVTKGGYPMQMLEEYEKIKLHIVENYLDGFRLLLAGTVDAVASDIWVGTYTLQENRLTDKIKVVEKPFTNSIVSIPVKKGNTALLNEINRGIAKMKQAGTVQEITDSWSGKQVVFFKKERIRQLIFIAVVIVVLLMISSVLFWIYMLRRQVRSKTEELRQALKSIEQKVEERTAELRDKEGLFRSLTKNAPNIIFMINREGEITFINRAPEGLDIGTITGTSMYPFMKQEHRQRVKDIVSEVFDSGSSLQYEVSGAGPNDTESDYLSNIGPVFGVDGSVSAAIIVAQDITERKIIEHQLIDSEKRYKSIVETTTEGVWVIDSKGVTTFVNSALTDSLGYSKNEMIGKHLFEFMDDAARENAKTYIARRAKGIKETHDFRFRTKDGKNVWALVSTNPIVSNTGEYAGALAMVSDITERKKMEMTIDSDRKRLFTLLDALPAFVYLQAPDYSIRFANKYYREHFGETEGVPCYKSLWGRDNPCEVCPTFKVFGSKKPQVWEWNSAPDGRIYEINDYPFTDTDGTDLVFEMGIDITARKKAEEELGQIFNLSADMICIADINGFFRKINPAFGKILGYTDEELMKSPFLDFVHPDDVQNTLDIISSSLEKGSPVLNFENRYRCKDGTYKWLSWTSNPVVAQGITFAIARDITESKKAEEQIKTALKEKEVLLQEVHHRVKNNFQVIISLLKLQSGTIQDENIKGIFSDSENRIRSMSLVHEMLYSTKDLANIDFRDYVQKLTQYMFRTYKITSAKVAIKSAIQDTILTTDTAIILGLVINELVSNSMKYAFPEGRRGEIRIDMKADHHSNCRGKAVPCSRVYELMIKDNGVGMPEGIDIRNTDTLGLRMVTNMITRQLNGSVEIKRDGGTEFLIRFKELVYPDRLKKGAT